MTDASGSSSYSYDSFDELTSQTNGGGQNVGYTYNPDGQMSSVSYPLPATATWATSDTVSYTHDHADLLTAVTDFNGRQISIGNNADGQPDSEALASTGDTISTTYGANDATSEVALKNSSSTLQSFSYSSAPAGNSLSEADTPSSTYAPVSYTYDVKGQVDSTAPASGPSATYSYDASGNLITTPAGATGSYDDSGDLTSTSLPGSSTDYTYNADGQFLTAKQGSTTSASATWNGAGEMTGYANSPATISSITYNGDGLRTSLTTTPSGGSPTTEAFTWGNAESDPDLLMDATNAYIYGSGNAPIEQINLTSGQIYYLVQDSGGSVRGIVNSSGSLVATTWYDAWGNSGTASGLTSYTPFGYADSYVDSTDLDYRPGWYYNSGTGQDFSSGPMPDQVGSSNDGAAAIAPADAGQVDAGASRAIDSIYCALEVLRPVESRTHTGQHIVEVLANIECVVTGKEYLDGMKVRMYLSRYVVASGGHKGGWEKDSTVKTCNFPGIEDKLYQCSGYLKCSKMRGRRHRISKRRERVRLLCRRPLWNGLRSEEP